jgi:hypothetical protein
MNGSNARPRRLAKSKPSMKHTAMNIMPTAARSQRSELNPNVASARKGQI